MPTSKLISPLEPKHRKGSFGGFMDKVLHRGHDDKDQAHQDKDEQEHEQEHEDQPKKESEVDKTKDYMKKDQGMEGEGRGYGDLM